MKRIILFTALLAIFSIARAQQTTCTLPFAKGKAWNGGLMRNGTIQQASNVFTIEPDDNGGYKVSDLSAGFFSQFSVDQKLNAAISFNCLDIVAASFETPYGPCKIISGKWDSSTKQLTIHWTIEFNEVDETSVFTLK